MLLRGRKKGGREDADDRSQCQIGRLIRRKEGWCMGAGVSKSGERDKEREGESSLKHQAIPVCSTVSIGPGYCRTHPTPVPCTVSIGQTTQYSFDCELSALELFV